MAPNNALADHRKQQQQQRRGRELRRRRRRRVVHRDSNFIESSKRNDYDDDDDDGNDNDNDDGNNDNDNNITINNDNDTTVLTDKVVSSRGMGIQNTKSRATVSREINNFITGEGKFGLYSETRAYFTVWTFITRLPGPTWVDHHPGYLMRGMAYFPLAGSIVGIFVSIVYDFVNIFCGLPESVASAACTAAGLWITGCFHEDGLADASDGIGGGWSRTQILRIMTDTRLGTYGCAVLLIYTVAKLELITALGKSGWWSLPPTPEEVGGEAGQEEEEEGVWDSGSSNSLRSFFSGGCIGAGPALIVMHTLSRLTSPYLIKTRDYIDETGPKYKFYSFMVQAKYLVSWERCLFATLTSLFVTTIMFGLFQGIILIIVVCIVSYLAGNWADYLLGGVMGDFLGATICITELVILTMILIGKELDILNVHAVEVIAYVQQQQLLVSSSHSFFSWEKEEEEGGGFLVFHNTWQHYVDNAMENERFRAFFRFMILVVITSIWCACVGHPDVLVRENAIEAAERAEADEEEEEEDAIDNDDECENINNDVDDEIPIRPAAQKHKCYGKVGQRNYNMSSHFHENDDNNVDVVSSPSGNNADDDDDGRQHLVVCPRTNADYICNSPTSSFNERYDAVRLYIDTLAKPVGSLGMLEDWSARLAALQRTIRPNVNHVGCLIFAADHGVAAPSTPPPNAPDGVPGGGGGEECSAYPQTVTRSILLALERGVAGASVLANINNVMLTVVDVGVCGDPIKSPSSPSPSSSSSFTGTVIVSEHKLPNGTKNFCNESAMSLEEVGRCIRVGRDMFAKQCKEKIELMVLGEIGIGNTTSSSALIAALTATAATTNDDIELICGAGATLSREADDDDNNIIIRKKVDIVRRGLQRHYPSLFLLHKPPPRGAANYDDNQEEQIEEENNNDDNSNDDNNNNKSDAQHQSEPSITLPLSALDALTKLGGAEIASLVGAILEASERNVPVLIDGFIVTTAALVSVKLCPDVNRVLFFSSKSAERGQSIAINAIQEELVIAASEKKKQCRQHPTKTHSSSD